MAAEIKLYTHRPVFSTLIIGVLAGFIWNELVSILMKDSSEILGMILYGFFAVVALAFLVLNEFVSVVFEASTGRVRVRRVFPFLLWAKVDRFELPVSFSVARKTVGQGGTTKLLINREDQTYPLTVLRYLSVGEAVRITNDMNGSLEKVLEANPQTGVMP